MAGVSSTTIRSFHHREFSAASLAAAKGGRRVSVCLPARDEEATVGPIVDAVRAGLVERHGLVDEIVVVDDGSSDGTAVMAAAAGARVVPGTGTGKGDAMWTSLRESDGDLVVWCDADVRNFGPRFVLGLLGPLLADDGVQFVKAFYDRPLDGRAGEGGRVTELVARPLLALLFPHLAGVRQPLAGECAGRREALESVPFVSSYGVDVALLVDIADRYGVEALAQVDLGSRVHRNRSLDELAPQAAAVIQALLERSPQAAPCRG